MTATWGLHSDRPGVDFLGGGFVAVGWSRLGDLREIGDDRDAMKAVLACAYPDARPRAIPVWAGMLLRFAFELRPGDLVVYPSRADATVNVGRVAGDYRWDGAAPEHRHRRAVDWLDTGLPRDVFSAGALRELGAALTVFRIRRHAAEFAAPGAPTPGPPRPSVSGGRSPRGPAARPPRPRR